MQVTYSAVMFDTVFPEATCREPLLDHHGYTVNQTLAHTHNIPC